MSKEFSFPNKGTCSKQTNFVLNDDHTIASIEVIGGCNGNLKGICQLLTGMKAEDAIARLDGTLCGFRSTSCPDQIAKNLKKYNKGIMNVCKGDDYNYGKQNYVK